MFAFRPIVVNRCRHHHTTATLCFSKQTDKNFPPELTFFHAQLFFTPAFYSLRLFFLHTFNYLSIVYLCSIVHHLMRTVELFFSFAFGFTLVKMFLHSHIYSHSSIDLRLIRLQSLTNGNTSFVVPETVTFLSYRRIYSNSGNLYWCCCCCFLVQFFPLKKPIY